MTVPAIHNDPCACPPKQCAQFVEPAEDCVNRLTGEVVTKACPECSPHGATWHHNGACLRCKAIKEGRL